jgi:hypothetical protein
MSLSASNCWYSNNLLEIFVAISCGILDAEGPQRVPKDHVVDYSPGVVFTTFHFLRNLQIGPIS